MGDTAEPHTGDSPELRLPIHVFWHVYVDHKRCEHCISIIRRQFSKLRYSGLLEHAVQVHIGYVSELPFLCPDILEHPNVHIDVTANEGYEGVTTTHMKRFCDELTTECSMLYIHTRGTTREPNTPTEDWTLMMEFFVIERWRHAVPLLSRYHTCGCEMKPHPRHRHSRNMTKQKKTYYYAGNFWWANSNYIKEVRFPTFANRWVESEFWILHLAGTKYPLTEFCVLHYTAPRRYTWGCHKIYEHRYPRENYCSGSETPDRDLASLLGKRRRQGKGGRRGKRGKRGKQGK